jgi:hypothetical protein
MKKKDGHMVDVATVNDPTTGLPFCRRCWNGQHERNGCHITGCQCGCYNGKNNGLGKPHRPAKGCEDQEKLPDVGTFAV